jgi:hypothetical protein
LAAADALLIVPEDVTDVPAGATLSAIVLRGTGGRGDCDRFLSSAAGGGGA